VFAGRALGDQHMVIALALKNYTANRYRISHVGRSRRRAVK
jgi:hypothetical protein